MRRKEDGMTNAVIMAAGMSSRFAPLSFEKPKGLFRVKGEILIEREIRQLQEVGITDITVVAGYMKEKFFYLEEKFGVKIVVNEDYYKYNNPSTLIRVLDKLENTYICSCDNYFVDNVFEEQPNYAYYAAVYAEGPTEEYCLRTDTEGRIIDVHIGGHDSWYMLGHVYFDEEFSKRFKKILVAEYEEAKDYLWEKIYMKHLDELDMRIRKYDADKVLEFDSLDDLCSFDPGYISNTDSRILYNICNTLNCKVKDIIDIRVIKNGSINASFKFTVRGKDYVYCHFNMNTEESMKDISKSNDTFVYRDIKAGWKISRYTREMDYYNDETDRK